MLNNEEEDDILVTAVKKGDLKTIKSCGKDLSKQYKDGNTLLHTAISSESDNTINVVKHFLNDTKLNATSLLEQKNYNGETPLHCAVLYDQDGDIKQLLLEKGANPNCINNKNETPLHYAINKNDTEALELLLKLGALPDKADIDGKTPLHYAAAKGDFEKVELLLKHEADPELNDHSKQKPADYAKRNGHNEVLELITKEISERNAFKFLAPNMSPRFGNTISNLMR